MTLNHSLVGSPRLRVAGFGAIALAAALWAIAAIVARSLFDAGVAPFELAMARVVVAVLGLGLAGQFRQPVRTWFNGRVLALGLSLALVTASYYVAIARLSVAVAIVIQYTAPAMVVVWTALRLRRPPTSATIVAVLAALVGVAFVSGMGNQQIQLDVLGLFAAGLSALFFASYALLSESLVDRLGAAGVMFRGFLVSSLFWVAFHMVQGFPIHLFATKTLLGIGFVGIGGTLIPFSLMCWGIQQVSAERGAIAASLEPVLAALFAWIWLSQSLSLVQLLGGGLVLIAVTLLQFQTATQANHER
ncbi:EamA family transporter [Leptolyngbya sp. AN02str]|uniref:EamA family transporter n=1 Tax=Leptolyngbya sp. AN02str TaxID=3423363 RepID=UPI003D31A5CA